MGFRRGTETGLKLETCVRFVRKSGVPKRNRNGVSWKGKGKAKGVAFGSGWGGILGIADWPTEVSNPVLSFVSEGQVLGVEKRSKRYGHRHSNIFSTPETTGN